MEGVPQTLELATHRLALPTLPNHTPGTQLSSLSPVSLLLSHLSHLSSSPLCSAAPPSRPGIDVSPGSSSQRTVFPIASLSPYQSKSASHTTHYHIILSYSTVTMISVVPGGRFECEWRPNLPSGRGATLVGRGESSMSTWSMRQ